MDPYGDRDLEPELDCVGRVWFAADPVDQIAVSFYELPPATVDAIRNRKTQKIKVAVYLTEGTRPKDLSMVLDAAFRHDPNILQLVVEGFCWPDDGEPTQTSLLDASVRER